MAVMGMFRASDRVRVLFSVRWNHPRFIKAVVEDPEDEYVTRRGALLGQFRWTRAKR